MAITMDKELLIRLPSSLYQKVKTTCEQEYKSISSFVRDLLREEIEESLTEKELKILEQESADFHKGKGVEWRKVKRGSL